MGAPPHVTCALQAVGAHARLSCRHVLRLIVSRRRGGTSREEGAPFVMTHNGMTYVLPAGMGGLMQDGKMMMWAPAPATATAAAKTATPGGFATGLAYGPEFCPWSQKNLKLTVRAAFVGCPGVP